MAQKFKVILPKKFYSKVALASLSNAMLQEGTVISKEYRKTYKTWKHKPKFEIIYRESETRIITSVLTSGSGSKQNPYPFVHSGTRVRYATMTPDFKAKTKPRIINSGLGRGGLAYVNKNKPRPGIKAREFTTVIKKRETPKFIARIKTVLISSAKKSGHYIKV